MADDASTDTSVNQDESTDDNVDDITFDEMLGKDESTEELEDTDLESDDEAESDESTDDSKESEENKDADESEESEEEQSEEENAPKTPEAAKNKEAFERRQQEKAAREARIRQAQADYVAEAQESEDPLAAQVRQLEVTTYNSTVQANENNLTNSYQKAMNDFPILNSDDPDIRAEIDATIDAFQSQFVQIDQFGNPVRVTGNFYETLQAKADSIERLTGIRQKNQEEAKAKQKSKSVMVPSKTPKEAKVDPDIAAFDEEAGW